MQLLPYVLLALGAVYRKWVYARILNNQRVFIKQQNEMFSHLCCLCLCLYLKSHGEYGHNITWCRKWHDVGGGGMMSEVVTERLECWALDRENLGLNALVAVSKLWQFLCPRCHSSLSCINESLAINRYMNEKSSCMVECFPEKLIWCWNEQVC